MTRLGKDLKIKETHHFDIQRRVVAHMTTEGWKIPHAGGVVETDITGLLDAFSQYKMDHKKKNPDAPRITLNTLLLKMFAEAIKEAPEMNAILKYYKPRSKVGRVDIAEDINISIPLITPGDKNKPPTTITPVIPGVGTKSLDEIALYVEDLMRRLKNTNIDELLFQTSMSETLYELKHFKLSVIFRGLRGLMGKHKVTRLKGQAKKEYYAIPESDRLTKNDIMNASILVSNIGSAYPKMNSRITLLEIIPPHVAVLGVSGIKDMPKLTIDEKGNKTLENRKMLSYTIMLDHRWVDFLQIMPFFKKVDEICGNPELVIPSI